MKFTFHDSLDETFQRQMYESALRDGLTKIFNKKYFLDRLESEFAYSSRHKSPLSLVLFDIEGWTHEEIGRHLEIAVGTSKSQLFDARRAMRALLQGGPEVRHA